MILTGQQIAAAVAEGSVVISPFSRAQLNPNSYNYRLSPSLQVHRTRVIDISADHPVDEITIPGGGIVLEPERVYLGSTMEKIGSEHYVPSLIGRSSLGRLGVYLQVSADLGNLGAVHQWTLEIVVCQPIRIYAEMIAGQVSFWMPSGAHSQYSGFFGQFDKPVTPHSGMFTVGY